MRSFDYSDMIESILIVIVMLIFAALLIVGSSQTKALERERISLEIEILLLEAENVQLRGLLSELRGQQGELQQKIEDWLEQWEVGEFELTFYTKECGFPWADGNTYTETLATPGRTIAVDPSLIALGSPVYISGRGWYRAEDVGSAVQGYIVDMYVGEGPEAYEEAMRLGRQTVTVAYQKTNKGVLANEMLLSQ